METREGKKKDESQTQNKSKIKSNNYYFSVPKIGSGAGAQSLFYLDPSLLLLRPVLIKTRKM